MGYKDLSDKTATPGRPIRATVDGLPITVEHENTQRHLKLGKIERVTMHWSVGPHAMAFDAYHVNVVFDAATRKAHVVKTLKYGQYGQHAKGANGNNIGVGFAAMLKTAIDTNQGKYPVTPEMLAVAAQFVAEFFCWHQLDPRVDLTDHKRVDAEAGITGRKFDIGPLFEPFKHDVIARYNALKAGKAKFCYKAILTD